MQAFISFYWRARRFELSFLCEAKNVLVDDVGDDNIDVDDDERKGVVTLQIRQRLLLKHPFS